MSAPRVSPARPETVDPPVRSTGRARGRHRKPAPRSRFARATTVGATAALPLAALALPGTAQAASTQTWDRLAQCESGGDWHINTGNGFYGGLQFTAGTWRGFGGEHFARRADLASRVEQITVAERVLDEQGWHAWPACSRKLGLDSGDAKGTPSVMTPRTDQKAAVQRKPAATGAPTAQATTQPQTRPQGQPQAQPKAAPSTAGPAATAPAGQPSPAQSAQPQSAQPQSAQPQSAQPQSAPSAAAQSGTVSPAADLAALTGLLGSTPKLP